MQMLNIRNKLSAVLLFVLLALASCSPVEEKKELSLGDTAPDFAVKDLAGDVVVLSSLKDRPVILRFFETNCRFCKADTPAFIDFYRQYDTDRLVILYIGSFYESPESLQKFADELGLIFPVAMDDNGRLAKLYDIRAYPQTIFLGPENTILAAILGGVGEAELREIYADYL